MDPGNVTRARFDVRDGQMAWGAIPWPDDLYLDGRGRIDVEQLPLADAEYAAELAIALKDLDGSGTRPTVTFPFDGPLDVRSLPSDPEESEEPAAAVFMLDADTGSPDVFSRVAIEVSLSEDERSLAARPAFGRTLRPGRRYAVVVTDAVRARGGGRVGPAAAFSAAKDTSTPATSAIEQRVRAEYAPVLDALAAMGVSRQRVVAMAVFRVQSVDLDLDDARALVHAREPVRVNVTQVVTASELGNVLGEVSNGQVGLQPGRGLAHEHFGALVHLRARVPTFASVVPGERTAFERDGEGQLVIAGEHDVPCTIAIPRSNRGAVLPVVLMQHGWRGDRSDALTLANELAAAGHAVLTCDAPFHGMRGPGGDATNRFTGAAQPDGFGDGFGDLLGHESDAGELVALHPFYYRDAFRQSVVEWMSIVHALSIGAWDADLVRGLESDGPTLARSDFGFVGIDLGAEVGVALAGIEPAVGACVLGFAGGLTVDDWRAGPGYAAFDSAIEERLAGSDDDRSARTSSSPDLDIVRMLLDRASGSAYASRLRRSATNVLMLIAVDDELVPNASTEALAYSVGAALVDAEPRFEPKLGVDLVLPGAAIAGNFDLRSGAVTRVAQSFEPAAHDALVSTEGTALYVHPLNADGVQLDEPETIANPTAEALDQIVFFFESYRACRSADTDRTRPCAASVSSLGDPTR